MRKISAKAMQKELDRLTSTKSKKAEEEAYLEGLRQAYKDAGYSEEEIEAAIFSIELKRDLAPSWDEIIPTLIFFGVITLIMVIAVLTKKA